MTKKRSADQQAPFSADRREEIKELADWRGEMLGKLRTLVKEADPEVIEEWKWRGVPVWEHAEIICTGETYKNVVKMTFANGASLEDPSGLFNASLEGNMRRAMSNEFSEGDKIDERALKNLILAAVDHNQLKKKKAPVKKAAAGTRATVPKNKKT